MSVSICCWRIKGLFEYRTLCTVTRQAFEIFEVLVGIEVLPFFFTISVESCNFVKMFYVMCLIASVFTNNVKVVNWLKAVWVWLCLLYVQVLLIHISMGSDYRRPGPDTRHSSVDIARIYTEQGKNIRQEFFNSSKIIILICPHLGIYELLQERAGWSAHSHSVR